MYWRLLLFLLYPLAWCQPCWLWAAQCGTADSPNDLLKVNGLLSSVSESLKLRSPKSGWSEKVKLKQSKQSIRNCIILSHGTTWVSTKNKHASSYLYCLWGTYMRPGSPDSRWRPPVCMPDSRPLRLHPTTSFQSSMAGWQSLWNLQMEKQRKFLSIHPHANKLKYVNSKSWGNSINCDGQTIDKR